MQLPGVPANRLKSIRSVLSQPLQRFPLTLLCSAMITNFLIIAYQAPPLLPSLHLADQLFWSLRCVGLFTLMLPASMAMHLLWEAGRRLPAIAFLIGFTGIGLYTLWWQTNGYWFVLTACILALVAAPHLKNTRSFWHFNHALFLSAAIAGICALIVFIGLSGAIWITGKLFDFRAGEVYGYAAAFSAGFLHCWVMLYFFCNAATEEDKPSPRITPFVATYILQPIFWIYAAILYAYVVKIAIEAELPKGAVAYVASIYILYGVALYLICWPYYETGKPWLRAFGRWFMASMLPPAILLLFATGIRIQNYGFTEARIALLVIGLWAIAMALAHMFFRRNIQRLLPASLAILLLLCAIGPLSAESISLNSQLSRLETRLNELGVLQAGKLQRAESPLSETETSNLAEDFEFFYYRERTDLLQPWFKDSGLTLDPENAYTTLKTLGLR